MATTGIKVLVGINVIKVKIQKSHQFEGVSRYKWPYMDLAR